MPDEETRRLYDYSGFRSRVGFGKRPAIVVVDMQQRITDPETPLGFDQTEAIEAINKLISAGRPRGIPIIFTRTISRHPNAVDYGILRKKVPAVKDLTSDSEGVDLDERLDRSPNDIVVDKLQASAFHGTSLRTILTDNHVDTVILTGNSTSGCIRATATYACAEGYRVIVPESGVADRAEAPHRANLFDIDSKLGDVMSLDSVLEHIEKVEPIP